MEKVMKVIGITGGVGSGKSTISKILEDKYHAFLINTDQVAHMLMQKDMISYRLIVDHFGKSILNQDGEIDRGLLGRIVYHNAEKLKLLNSYTHPYVMEHVRKLIQGKIEENLDLLCVETALPAEAGLKDFCDQIWYIYAPEDVRKSRLKSDRNYTDQKIDHIFMSQMKDEEYRNVCTYTLNNNGSIDEILHQIEVLLEK